MKLTIHIDGGSRGNPGPAGAGVVVRDGDKLLLDAGFFLGRMTNNMAEYSALLRALDFAGRAGASDLTIFSDSQLLVRQINGDYRVKNRTLKGLFDAAKDRLRSFAHWRIEHVPREANRRADRLANLAMDAGRDVASTGGADPETTPVADRPPAAAIVTARCVRAADPRACPAPCRRGTEFLFDKVVPPGLCLGIAAGVLHAVEAAADDDSGVDVVCPRAGCGARFLIRRT